MVKDYWLYQKPQTAELSAREPWAAHVRVYDGRRFNARIYAEYADLPAHARAYFDIPVSYEALLSVFEEFSDEYDVAFTLDEIQQINGLWLKIANDFNIHI